VGVINYILYSSRYTSFIMCNRWWVEGYLP